ncbi:MAG: hypothetical protein JWM35_847 [Verrucomicrobia bacterium]|nr:hypothetical protein [Verrucomicrobiota bacterium]
MNHPDANADVQIETDFANDVIRLKAVATFDEPVELTADEARELAQQLLRMADEL